MPALELMYWNSAQKRWFMFGDNYPFPSATIRIPFQIPEV